MPAGVGRVEICWPLGIAASAQDAGLCQQRFKAWVLDGAIPPTFAERDARLWSAGLERFDVDDATGLRLSADCARPHARRPMAIARWPALASPWLSASTRRASRPPALAPDCVDDGRDMAELRIEGLADGAALARPPGSSRAIRLSLRALGSDATIQWLLDGRWIATTRGANAFQHGFQTPGAHRLTALAQTGAWASVDFRILP